MQVGELAERAAIGHHKVNCCERLSPIAAQERRLSPLRLDPLRRLDRKRMLASGFHGERAAAARA